MMIDLEQANEDGADQLCGFLKIYERFRVYGNAFIVGKIFCDTNSHLKAKSGIVFE